MISFRFRGVFVSNQSSLLDLQKIPSRGGFAKSGIETFEFVQYIEQKYHYAFVRNALLM